MIVNGKCNLLKGTKGAFSELKRRGFSPDLAYNTMIGIYRKHGFIDQALDMLKNMKQNGWKPYLITYISFVSIYGREGNYKKLEAIQR